MANWTAQIIKERGRQVSLTYTNEHNDKLSAQEWDVVFQTWWTFILQAALAGDVELLRKRIREVAALGYALGQAVDRKGKTPSDATD